MRNEKHVVTNIKCKHLVNDINCWLNKCEQTIRGKWISLRPYASDSQTQIKLCKDSDDDNTLNCHPLILWNHDEMETNDALRLRNQIFRLLNQ